jgi:UDP-N-acetylmuramoyl-L-alanyl-D-glutamate--2,6-diaminopimelate ligase
LQIKELVQKITHHVGYVPFILDEACEVHSLCANSQEAQPGALFVCMPSESRDTAQFIPEAKANGAVACLVHTPEGLEIARQNHLGVIGVDPAEVSFLKYLGHLCSVFHGDPSCQMRMVGVTGTNGKTTTCWILRKALEALGQPTAYLGTLGYITAKEHLILANTTPFPVELWTLLSMAHKNGIQNIVMEASSHGLLESRLAGVHFDVGAFTNLTQDHLDYHGTMESYAAAKKLLFTEYAATSSKPFVGVLNKEDPQGAAWAQELQNGPHKLLTYGFDQSDLRVEVREIGLRALKLCFSFEGSKADSEVGLGGTFNVFNCSTAVACLLALGHSLEEACEAMRGVDAAPGRLQTIPNSHGVHVIVDYAHTPDALKKLLLSVRELRPHRVITVFGCGGDRDRAKRPLMGAVASQYSDVSIVTSDNPRTEDPQQIVNEILTGICPGAVTWNILDRQQAIHEAVRMSQPGDVVVIAGKGHEDYQIIGSTKYPMDDREIAREALAAKK